MTLKQPTTEEIIAARQAAGHTQEQAALLVYLSRRDRWSEFERGVRPIELARWELYLLKTDQHPTLRTSAKRPLQRTPAQD